MPDPKHRKSAVAMMMVAGGLVAAAPSDTALAQGAETGILCNEIIEMQCNGMPQDFFVVGNKLYFVGKDGSKIEAPDGKWITPDGKVIVVEGGFIVSQ